MATPTKKRRADKPAEEAEEAPSRKSSKTEPDEVSQELIASHDSSNHAKRPWRSIKEAKRVHKERVRA